MHFPTDARERFNGRAKGGAGLDAQAALRGDWRIVAKDPQGNVLRDERFSNLVVDTGLDYLLDAGLSGAAQISPWYVGLTGSTPTPAAGDTPASHAGWTEETGYDEAARQAWTDGGVSGQSVDNSGSVATFTVTANGTTFGGAFLISDNTKGGSTGTLYAVGAFSGGDLTLSAGSTIEVTATFSTQAV